MHKEFKTETEVETWLNEYYHDWIESLQKNARVQNSVQRLLFEYGGNSSILYNRLLRATPSNISLAELINKNTNSEFSEILKDVQHLVDFLSNSKIPEGITVYRYTKIRDILRLFKNKEKARLLKEWGFLSTTLIPENESLNLLIKNENYNAIMKIHVPKGANGIPLKFCDEQTKLQEYEMLFSPGQKLKLVKAGFSFKWMKFVFEFDMLLDK